MTGADHHKECDHPVKPKDSSDKEIAGYIAKQGKKIDICRELLK